SFTGTTSCTEHESAYAAFLVALQGYRGLREKNYCSCFGQSSPQVSLCHSFAVARCNLFLCFFQRSTSTTSHTHVSSTLAYQLCDMTKSRLPALV
ncbi:hypothetical protein JI435_423140, partial [Parastagonospora nodorum SN15]